MKTLGSFIAGLWLFAVGVQGLSHLARYGLLPLLPERVGRLDFTPEYTLLMGLVILASVASRYIPVAEPVRAKAVSKRGRQ